MRRATSLVVALFATALGTVGTAGGTFATATAATSRDEPASGAYCYRTPDISVCGATAGLGWNGQDPQGWNVDLRQGGDPNPSLVFRYADPQLRISFEGDVGTISAFRSWSYEQHRLHSARFRGRQRVSCEIGCTSAVLVYDLHWIGYGPRTRNDDCAQDRCRAAIVSGTISLDGDPIVVVGRWVPGVLSIRFD